MKTTFTSRVWGKIYRAEILCPVFFLVLSVYSNSTLCQNILLNASFESIDSINQNRHCSINFGYTDIVNDWCGINTVDYAHNSKPFTNRSGKDKLLPYDGDAMIGLFLKDMGDGWLPEYIFQKLDPKLKFAGVYKLSGFIHFRKLDKYSVRGIQLKLTNGNPCKLDPRSIEGQIINIDIPIINDTTWINFNTTFTSDQDFNYIIVGLFNESYKSSKKDFAPKNTENGVYIFIDNLSLIPLSVSNNSIVAEKDQNRILSPSSADLNLLESKESKIVTNRILANKLVELNALPTINFEHNSFNISESQIDLYLQIIPILILKNLNITISGHADNSGNEAYNLDLSSKRAEIVKKLFLDNGFSREKLKLEYFGSSKPLVNGNSDQDRAINRRVELKIN